MASGYNTGPRMPTRSRSRLKKQQNTKKIRNIGDRAASSGTINQGDVADMSKESIQEVVQKSLEDYFNDLGEQKPSNIYDMMLLTVEKPILQVVMTRAEGNQSHAAQMLGINRNTLRKKLQEHGLL
jgi:Fis family transcriptional regulator